MRRLRTKLMAVTERSGRLSAQLASITSIVDKIRNDDNVPQDQSATVNKLRSDVAGLHNQSAVVSKLRNDVNVLQDQSAFVNQIRKDVNVLQDQGPFVNQIRNDVNILQDQMALASRRFAEVEVRYEPVDRLPGEDQEMMNQLQSRVGTPMVLDTVAGTVSGTLTFVGEDFVEITEPSGSVAVVRMNKVNAMM